MTCELPELDTSTDDDPLAGIGIDVEAAVAAINPPADTGLNRISEFLEKPARDGEPLFLDFETIPDFHRMDLFELEPLPTMPPIDGPDALMPVDQFVSQAVPEIASWLSKHNPPKEWIDSIRAAEQSTKKPRKGFYDALDDHTKRLGSIASAEADRVKMLSVNPLYCSICCVSFAVGQSDPVSIYAGSERMMEKHLVEMVWRMLARHTPIIGYGLSFFDIPVLLARSMILNVHPTRNLDRRKYGSRDIVDLCKSIFEDGRAFGLGKVCKSLGIQSTLPDVDGSHVYDMYKAGQVGMIRAYCEDDVRLAQQLHKRVSGYFCV